LVLFFLKKILTGDTESAVNRLNESYEEVKKKKEELLKMIADLNAEYNKRKEEADKISNEIVDKAKADGEAQKTVIIKSAKEESEGIISKAMGTVDNIRREVTTQMEFKTIEFCGELLKGVLSRKASAQINDVFVKEFIEERDLTIVIVFDISRSCEFATVGSLKKRELDLSRLAKNNSGGTVTFLLKYISQIRT